jgi:MarR family 2-MHQ and catechol resistance regulon transcriptional repressor
MGTHYQGSPEAVAALDAYIKLIRAAESVLGRVFRRTRSGVTNSQLGVLEALLHLGPLCQRDLGSRLLKSGGNVTLVIDNLEKRALVERRRDQKDRRRISVHLTPEGDRLIREVFPRHVRSIVAEMSPLSGAEQAELGRLCRRLGRADHLGAADAGSGPGAQPAPASVGTMEAQRK